MKRAIALAALFAVLFGLAPAAAQTPPIPPTVAGNTSITVNNSTASAALPYNGNAFHAVLLVPDPGASANVYYAQGGAGVTASSSSAALPSGGICISDNNQAYVAVYSTVSVTVRITILSSCPQFARGPSQGGTTVTTMYLDFAANTVSGCSSFAACLNTSRASAETCDAGAAGITYVANNTPCLTSAGFGSTYPASVNLLLQSNFGGSAWTVSNGTLTPNAIVSPDGTMDGATLVESTDSANQYHQIVQTIAKSAVAQTYAVSVYGGRNGSNNRYVYFNATNPTFSSGTFIVFDTINGTASASGGSYGGLFTNSPAQVSVSANNDFRISFTFTTDNSASLVIAIGLCYQLSNNDCDYIGAGVDGASLFCAQLELVTGTNLVGPTPCMPTTAATASRAADVVTAIGPLATLLAGSNVSVQATTNGGISGAAGTFLDANGVVLLGKNSSNQITTSVGSTLTSAATASWGLSGILSALSWTSAGGVLNVNNSYATSDAVARNPTGPFHLGSVSGTLGFLGSSIAQLVVTSPAVTYPVYPGLAYYVNSSTGIDTNNGLSPTNLGGGVGPWQTAAKVSAGTYRGNDSITLLTNLTGCIDLSQTNIAPGAANGVNAVTLQGSGSPTLTTNCTGSNAGGVSLNGVSGVIVSSFGIVSGATSPRAGVEIFSSSGGYGGNCAGPVVVQNMDIQGFDYYTAAQPTNNFGGEVFIDGDEGGCLTNISVVNNILCGASPSSKDNNATFGFGNGKDIFSSVQQGNIACNQGATATGGALAGSLGNGLYFGSVQGGNALYNYVHDLGGNTNTCGGPAGVWTGESDSINSSFNEGTNIQPVNGQDGCDWGLHDCDNNSTNCIMQYYYSHGNTGYGCNLFAAGTWGPATCRYGISENDSKSNGVSGAISYVNTPTQGYVYNNTIWMNSGGPSGHRPACMTFTSVGSGITGVVANNICAVNVDDIGDVKFVQTNGGSSTTPTGVLWAANAWFNMSGGGTTQWNFGTSSTVTTLAAWQAVAANGDAGATTANPGFSGTGGTGGSCTWTPSTQSSWPPSGCPTPYTLAGGSAMLGTGVALMGSPYNVSSIGARASYYSASGPSSPYDIGAYHHEADNDDDAEVYFKPRRLANERW
jgi:hypothetical protein